MPGQGLMLERGVMGSSSGGCQQSGTAAACAAETALAFFVGKLLSPGVLVWLNYPRYFLVPLLEAVGFFDRPRFLKLTCLAAVSVVLSEHAFLQQSHPEGISSSYMLS